MKIPCNNAIRCPGPVSQGYDYPVANFSSERPDAPIFIAANFGWDYNVAPLGTVWSTPGCTSWCVSEVSQDAADLCAARQQIACLVHSGGDPSIPPGGDGSSDPSLPPAAPGGAPGTPPGTPGSDTTEPKLFANSGQECTTKCPDGSTHTEKVGYGEVLARSQVLADNIAHSLACKHAASFLCVPSLNGFSCSDPFSEHPEYKFQYTAVTVNVPVVWSTAGGSLPPGLTLDPDGLLHGYPSTPGDYSFTVRATDSTSKSTDKPQKFHVLGLKNPVPSLPDAKVDQPYTNQLEADGGAVLFFISDGSLPTGLTMSDSGLISGTPTVLAGSMFTVTVQDIYLNECGQQMTLEITGPKFTNAQPPDGTQCTAYNFTFTAIGDGAVTFSGSMPYGLTMTSAGVVSGAPTKSGAQNFVITAVDAKGNTNSKTWTVNIVSDGSGIAKSVSDLVWTQVAPTQDYGGSTVSGAPTNGGSFSIVMTVPKNNLGGGTCRRVWVATLGRCAAQAPYNVTCNAVATFSRGSGVTTNSSSIISCALTVHNGAGETVGWNGSASGSPAVSPPSNMKIDLQITGATSVNDDTVLAVTITITPPTPP